VAVYIVTGKLGNGKTLISVGRIRDKLRAGCIVATNLDLDLKAMFGSFAKNLNVVRVPDKPSIDDLQTIGVGNSSYDESKNGLLVLDECGTWFNSRNWQDKARKDVNDWFLHARKLGWDVMLIVQDISLIDSQAREAIAEHTVFCRRIDNLAIPIIGTAFKLFTGSKLKLPRVHSARVVYGTSPLDLLADRWIYRGTDLFACYDTKQLFLADYPHGAYSMLTPWHRFGRFMVTRDLEFYMRMTKIFWKRFKSPIALGVGCLLGVSMASAAVLGLGYRDLQQQKAQVAQVQPATTEPEKKPPSQLFFERLGKLRIDSAGNFNGVYRYKFRDDSNEKSTAYLSTDKLQASGVTIVGYTDCQAQLIYKGKSTTVYCL